MATVSKSSRPRKTPNQTRNGKVRIYGMNIPKLIEMAEKAIPKNRDKIQRRINNLTK